MKIKKFVKNKKNIIVIAVVVLIMIILGVVVVKKRAAQNELLKTNYNDKSFDGQVRDFNEVYKKTLLAINNKQNEEAERGIREVLAYWLEIEKNFLKNKPREYIITRNWEEKIITITELTELTKDLVDHGDYEEAFKQLEKVRQKIKQLREENRIKNISNNFLSLSEEVDKLSQIEKREEAIILLPELKIKFTETKEFLPTDQDFQAKLNDFAAIISDIENSSETTYKKNRDRLKPAFLEIYLKFG